MAKYFVFGFLMAYLSLCMYIEGMPMSSMTVILLGAFLLFEEVKKAKNSKI